MLDMQRAVRGERRGERRSMDRDAAIGVAELEVPNAPGVVHLLDAEHVPGREFAAITHEGYQRGLGACTNLRRRSPGGLGVLAGLRSA